MIQPARVSIRLIVDVSMLTALSGLSKSESSMSQPILSIRVPLHFSVLNSEVVWNSNSG